MAGPFVLVAAAAMNTLAVVDVSDPTNPTLYSSLTGGGAPNYMKTPHSIAIRNNLVYVSTGNGLTIVDISDLLNMVTISNFEGDGPPNWLGPFDLGYGTGPLELDYPYIYIVGVYIQGGTMGISIIDVTDPYAPVNVGHLGSTRSVGDPFTPPHLWWPSVARHSGRYLYATAEASPGPNAFNVIDIINPAAPNWINFISGAGAPNFLSSPRGFRFDGNYAYVIGSSDNSLSIFDMTVPTAPVFVSKVSGAGPPNWMQAPADLKIVGNLAYVCALGEHSLTIVDITNPLAPSTIGHIAGGANHLLGIKDVDIVGNTAYCTAYIDYAMTVVDVTDPTAPVYVGHYSPLSQADGCLWLPAVPDPPPVAEVRNRAHALSRGGI